MTASRRDDRAPEMSDAEPLGRARRAGGLERYAPAACRADLALRVYTTRLLGGDPKLVLHGGGNTSVKTRDDGSRRRGDRRALRQGHRLGHGGDRARRHAGGAAQNLRKLRAQDDIADDRMVAVQRANLIDPMAPNPSVETLLHAFMPHKFVDHTHSTALLGVVDQPDGENARATSMATAWASCATSCRASASRRRRREVFDANPKVGGLILDKHGIFTFGADAREAYERMIEMVTLAEARAEAGPQVRVRLGARCRSALAPLAAVAPILRGARAPAPT